MSRATGKGPAIDESACSWPGWSDVGRIGAAGVRRHAAEPGAVARSGGVRSTGLGIPTAKSRGLDWCHDRQELGQAWRVRVPGVETRSTQTTGEFLTFDPG